MVDCRFVLLGQHSAGFLRDSCRAFQVLLVQICVLKLGQQLAVQEGPSKTFLYYPARICLGIFGCTSLEQLSTSFAAGRSQWETIGYALPNTIWLDLILIHVGRVKCANAGFRTGRGPPRIGALNTEWMIERGGVEAFQELAVTRSQMLYVARLRIQRVKTLHTFAELKGACGGPSTYFPLWQPRK